jgi:hypothetical protein
MRLQRTVTLKGLIYGFGEHLYPEISGNFLVRPFHYVFVFYSFKVARCPR